MDGQTWSALQTLHSILLKSQNQTIKSKRLVMPERLSMCFLTPQQITFY